MPRYLSKLLGSLAVAYGLLSLAAGLALPRLLLQAPVPSRTEAERASVRARISADPSRWTTCRILGGQGATLELWHLRRPQSKGTVILLHGFADDAWGTAPLLNDLPDWDAVVFTFRGRDRDPAVPCTLGAWERWDICAVVAHLESEGIPRDLMVLVGQSQGAGIALLALPLLEAKGRPLLGTLVESPFMDLRDATSNHLRGTLGPLEVLARPAEFLALLRAGQIADFNPDEVSPIRATRAVKTRIAYLAGDRDAITPLNGVKAVAGPRADLTVVPGAMHLEAGQRYPGGWKAWAGPRLASWSGNRF